MGMVNPAITASEKALAKMFSAIENNKSFRMEAGAGAGKTYSLIKALKHFITNKATSLEKAGQQIACITYTNVAKDEIKERTDNHPLIFTDTIHAFSWSLLQAFQPMLRETIPTLSDRWATRIKDAGGLGEQKVIYDLGYPKADAHTIELHHDDVIKLMAILLTKPKLQTVIKSKFPILFVDEYQDTNKSLADSIVKNIVENDVGVLVGLFGDHWQKIYGSSACGLVHSSRIIEIGMKANFRSDKDIVACLNRMRPKLPQNEVDPDSKGEIQVFHSNGWQGSRLTANHWQEDLPASDAHEYLERVKHQLKQSGWDFESEYTKVLMLTNNVLASEQGYRTLAGCFSNTDDYLKKNNHYIKFFLETIEPMCEYFEKHNYGEMFSIINSKRPQLTSQEDKVVWSKDFQKLMKIREESTIREVLEHLESTHHPRLSAKVDQAEKRLNLIKGSQGKGEVIQEGDLAFAKKMKELGSISYSEVISLYRYVEDKTPFSTKHGVKGAEFENVLIICGRGWNNYNWNQFLEWFKNGAPSNKQEAFERNRNLFYVSCSRAKKRVALLFTQELSSTSLQQLEYLFGKENIIGEPLINSNQ